MGPNSGLTRDATRAATGTLRRRGTGSVILQRDAQNQPPTRHVAPVLRRKMEHRTRRNASGTHA